MAPIAAPSRVIPGTAAHNARFLAQRAEGRIREIALCFFETQDALACTEDELPAALAELPFSWHVHLPVDLPWGSGAGAAAACALRLMHKARALQPRMAVLHAPELPGREGLLEAFADLWHARSAVPLLLENIATCGLVDLAALIVDAEFGVCLDLGHMLAYGQQNILYLPELVSRVQLAHWSAPGGADRHLPLTRLTGEEKSSVRAAAAQLPATTTHLLEIFDWNGVEESLALLAELLPARHEDGAYGAARGTAQETRHGPDA
ncbi:MAG: sugar phosphate isomerase/epimerase [Deltaproteobacteria bacterium]|jgi:sugar phosphate isomerase/epimerase|nr:sugar phosphate isomerase/epimerase [Deltaproteobacteria bacterium]